MESTYQMDICYESCFVINIIIVVVINIIIIVL